MNKLKLLFITIVTTILLINNIYAEDKGAVSATSDNDRKSAPLLKDSTEYQKVIEEYKNYVASLPAEIRDELITYRKEIAKLNKQKRILYRKLTQDSQDYLKKEQQYKKRLPLQRKNLINLEGSAEKDKDNESADVPAAE